MAKRLIRRPKVSEITGLASSSIYEVMAKGRFPKSVPISPGRVAWVEEEILDWVAARVKERDEGRAELTAQWPRIAVKRLRMGLPRRKGAQDAPGS